jgi:DNA-binding MarR family transcriptional regulator
MSQTSGSTTWTGDEAGRELAPEELAAWRGLLQAHSQLTRALDADLSRDHELPLASYEVLLFLAGAPDGRLRMSELAESVLLSRSGVSRLVDRLERDGLIERTRCPEDARGLYAAITDAGRSRFRAARPTHLAGVRRHFLRHYSSDELRQVGRLWQRLLPD